jgi:hypothetical protein
LTFAAVPFRLHFVAGQFTVFASAFPFRNLNRIRSWLYASILAFEVIVLCGVRSRIDEIMRCSLSMIACDIVITT